MADILDEVLNEDKEQKRLVLFRRMFPVIIITMVLGALGIAGYNWHVDQNIRNNQQVGDTLIDLIAHELDDQEFVQNSLIEIIHNSKNKQTELAELQLVAHLNKTGKNLDAMLQLEKIIDNKNYHDITTSYARLLWLSMLLDQQDISDSLQMKARNYMNHFVNKEQVFFASATLMKAIFYQKSNQLTQAMEYAEQLIRLDNASIVIKEQAKALITNIKNNA
ncbi:MAG: DUF2659 family protein [Rickettsiaceae bacterium]